MLMRGRIKCLLESRFHQSTSAVRREFIKFFEERDHIHMPSSSVLPNDDDRSLLFVNSGMNQFKSTILGNSDERRSHLNKVVNYQKCIRVSGKHNDLDDVGKDAHHQTFFEMLGNWAFNGAYDKKVACEYSWKFLVERMQLDPNRLYVSYFGGDRMMGIGPDLECQKIWAEIGLPADKILPFTSENFWEMGKVGPCGPCTEIHYDRIGGRNASHLVNRDDSVVEIWNLVFMMYKRNPNGVLSDLASFHIDTGMGLERLASIVQNVSSNYEIDVFTPIIRHIQKISNADNWRNKMMSQRIIADHLRTFVIAYSDGAQPGQTDAGRQIRMILRRAFRHAVHLGITKGMLQEVVPIVVDTLKDAYPGLVTQIEWMQYSLNEEENWYWEIMKGGRAKFDDAVSKLPKDARTIPGALIMKLKSQGVTEDMSEAFAQSKGLTLDKEEFDRLAKLQKETGNDPTFQSKLNVSIEECPTHSDAEKYRLDENLSTRVLRLFDASGNPTDDLNGYGYLVLENSQFFAFEGGQAGDHGLIKTFGKDAKFEVSECTKINGISVLNGCTLDGSISVQDTVQQFVDKERRSALMRAHSATHLLNWALQRTSVGCGQTGSGVHPDQLRFEYSPGECASEEDSVLIVESFVQNIIKKGMKIQINEVDLDSARKMTHLQSQFREGKTYPPKVRVVNVLDDDGNMPIAGETCCGTHVTSTNDILDFTIISDLSLGKGARRIVAVTGEKVVEARMKSEHHREELNRLLANGAKVNALDKFVKTLPIDEMPYVDLRAIRLKVREAMRKLKEEAKRQKKKKMLG
ncbi:unnamed protein product, partial [Mesorhabditis belari]|uniref:Alanine--tRNA ligase n=1 Tax=Mesorhabditis belari TaxID=2138241 RepID=A0AAF3EEN9_9BILA